EENALAQCRLSRVDVSRYTDISDARSGNNHDICPNLINVRLSEVLERVKIFNHPHITVILQFLYMSIGFWILDFRF
ncbi:MAG: hypothetical protein AAGG00_20780, partial [Cyanobacteria bacterium P01_H01_bin.150]